MLVHVKKPHIDIEAHGEGSEELLALLRATYSDVVVEDEDEELVDFFQSDLYQENRPAPGEVVRHHRELAGMSQAELGEKVGKSRQFISDIEMLRRNISVDFAKRLGEVLEHDYHRYL